MGNLLSDLGNYLAGNKNLEAMIKAQEKAIERLEKENAESKRKVADIEKRQKIDLQVQVKLAAQEEELKGLKRENDQLRAQNDGLKRTVAELDKQKTDLQGKLDAKEAQQSEQLANFGKEIDKLKQEFLEAQKREISEGVLSERIAEQQERLDQIWASSKLAGRWKLEKEDNREAYEAQFGGGFLRWKTHPIIEFEMSADNWRMCSICPDSGHTFVNQFELGQQFEHDGKYRVTFGFEEGRLVGKEVRIADGKESLGELHIDSHGMLIVTMRSEKARMYCKYVRVTNFELN